MRRLVIRNVPIGDFILSLPALQCLSRGCEHFEVWTSPALAPLVRFADAVRPVRGPRGLWSLLRSESLARFDSIIMWSHTGIDPAFTDAAERCVLFAEGETLSVFTDTVYSAPPPYRVVFPEKRPLCSRVQMYLDMVREFAPDVPSDAVPRIECNAGSLQNYAVIHPFSSASKGDQHKDWSLGQFRALARSLERAGLPVHWCAAPDDPPLDGAVRMTSLWELACWISRARLYVGNDSGISHLAAAVGAPVLVFFGPTDLDMWAPRGGNVRVARFMGSWELAENLRAPHDR